MTTAEELLGAALARRDAMIRELGEGTDAYRVVHDSADGFPGVTVDRLGPAVLVERHREDGPFEDLVEALAARFGEETPIFEKRRWTARSPCVQVGGARMDPDFRVIEHGLRFNVSLKDGEHQGVFLDTRPARRVVRELAAGKRVLNLFAYTGGFGLAAAAGGAHSTTNVDNKRSAVAAAAANYRLNDLPVDGRTCLRSDAEKYLARVARGGHRYDLIVADPPPRYDRPGRTPFDARRSFAPLVRRIASALAPGGILVAGLNALYVDDGELERMLNDGVRDADRSVEVLRRVGPGPDFPPCESRPRARFLVCRLA